MTVNVICTSSFVTLNK